MHKGDWGCISFISIRPFFFLFVCIGYFTLLIPFTVFMESAGVEDRVEVFS